MTRTPRHLIQAAKEHAVGREQDIFLQGAKYGHASKTISSTEFQEAEDAVWARDDIGLTRAQCGDIIFTALLALGIGITVDRPQEDE